MRDARKKIFLGWNGPQSYAVSAIRFLRERGYDTVYWVATDENGTRIPGTIFHDKTRADRGFPAEEVDPSAFPPPEAEMVHALYKTESLAFTMMNRFSTSVDEKKRLYHEMLRYWNGVLETYRPNCVVLSCFPHPFSMFILYSVARLEGIPVIFMHETYASYRLLFNYDYEKGPPLLSARLYTNTNSPCSISDLPDDLQEFYARHRTGKDTSPTYVKDLARMYAFGERTRSALRIVMRSVVDGSFLARAYRVVGRTFDYSLRKEFKLAVTKPDLTVPFVYVPLHLQPEAATSPLGDVFADQTLMLEILSQALPKGWFLYVKENPYQFQWGKGTTWSPARYPGYYKKIAALGNVRIVPLATDTFELIAHSKAVAAVTGTALAEAMFRDKPALMFGYQWYMDMPGLMHIDGPDSARAALTRVAQGYRPDQGQILAFLKSFGEASIRGVIDRLLPDEERGVTHEDTVPRVTSFLADEMDRVLR